MTGWRSGGGGGGKSCDHEDNWALLRCTMSVLRAGQSEEAEVSSTWFWFKLISMACSSDTSRGTFWILLRDRSSRSRFLREPSPDGNSDIWFPDRLSVRRALSWPRLGGNIWIWFPFRLRVSSFFSWEISEGRHAEDTHTHHHCQPPERLCGPTRTEQIPSPGPFPRISWIRVTPAGVMKTHATWSFTHSVCCC